MGRYLSPNAKLISEIDLKRVDLSQGDAMSLPTIGDLVFVDQGFAGPEGRDMYIVYCQNPDGSIRWTADLSEDELEPLGAG